jgi:ketosteroid isomerase-like protein
MQYPKILTGLAVLLSSLTLGADMSETPSSKEEQALAAEDAYVAAEISRDEDALRRLIDDRFVYNSNDGTTFGKETLVKSVLGMNMVSQTISERSVVVEGDIAIIFGTAEIQFGVPGKDNRISTLRYTSTYVNREGQWRMIALQMVPRS